MDTTTIDRQVFPRTIDQRTAALLVANSIRSRRAAIKRQAKASEVTITHLLQNVEAATARMKVRDLLAQTPKWGRVKADRALLACRISGSKTVGGLSDRQRTELVAYLGGR